MCRMYSIFFKLFPPWHQGKRQPPASLFLAPIGRSSPTLPNAAVLKTNKITLVCSSSESIRRDSINIIPPTSFLHRARRADGLWNAGACIGNETAHFLQSCARRRNNSNVAAVHQHWRKHSGVPLMIAVPQSGPITSKWRSTHSALVLLLVPTEHCQKNSMTCIPRCNAFIATSPAYLPGNRDQNEICFR